MNSNVLNLFGESGGADYHDGSDGAIAIAKSRNGIAGHNLVVADLLIRGHEAANMDGIDTDIIAIIGGTIRKFQVKATMDSLHFGPTKNHGKTPGRSLVSYQDKIDGFAFVYLAKRAVYYVHPKAVISTHISIPQSHWGRQQCDLSFDELLKRWDCL